MLGHNLQVQSGLQKHQGSSYNGLGFCSVLRFFCVLLSVCIIFVSVFIILRRVSGTTFKLAGLYHLPQALFFVVAGVVKQVFLFLS